jgi:hypothetical protein
VSAPPRTVRTILAALLLAAAAGCGGEEVDGDLRDIEASFEALRDAILQGDDEAFFSLHSRAAREAAVAEFPRIRAGYLAAPEEEREAFRRLYRVTAEEFLEGNPRDLVVRMMPWKSGWRDRREMYRRARVKDVRIDHVKRPDGTMERRGIVTLDVSASLAPGEVVPERYLPTVVLEKDPEGWRRRTFFME